MHSWEKWASGNERHRKGVEFLPLWINWEECTNEEIGRALAEYRPAGVPEPTREMTKAGRRKTTQGKGQEGHYFKLLRSLAVWRLAETYPVQAARKMAGDLGVVRYDDYRRCCSVARRHFAEMFGEFEAGAE